MAGGIICLQYQGRGAIRAVLSCRTARFMLPNGPYGDAPRAVWQHGKRPGRNRLTASTMANLTARHGSGDFMFTRCRPEALAAVGCPRRHASLWRGLKAVGRHAIFAKRKLHLNVNAVKNI